MIFLDNASTTKVFDLAVEKMNIIYLEDYFNPSATYKGGREVLSNISQARENVAKYLSAKKELAELKQKIDNSTESEKDGYLEEFRQKLNNITTLNTKLNNQLKSERDRLESIKASTKKMFSSKAKELISIRVELMNSTRIELKALLSDYMLELKELNSAFNEEFKEGSFPFDVASMGDSLVAGKLENECYTEILSENFNKNAIFSENSNEIVS